MRKTISLTLLALGFVTLAKANPPASPHRVLTKDLCIPTDMEKVHKIINFLSQMDQKPNHHPLEAKEVRGLVFDAWISNLVDEINAALKLEIEKTQLEGHIDLKSSREKFVKGQLKNAHELIASILDTVVLNQEVRSRLLEKNTQLIHVLARFMKDPLFVPFMNWLSRDSAKWTPEYTAFADRLKLVFDEFLDVNYKENQACLSSQWHQLLQRLTLCHTGLNTVLGPEYEAQGRIGTLSKENQSILFPFFDTLKKENVLNKFIHDIENNTSLLKKVFDHFLTTELNNTLGSRMEIDQAAYNALINNPHFASLVPVLKQLDLEAILTWNPSDEELEYLLKNPEHLPTGSMSIKDRIVNKITEIFRPVAQALKDWWTQQKKIDPRQAQAEIEEAFQEFVQQVKALLHPVKGETLLTEAIKEKITYFVNSLQPEDFQNAYLNWQRSRFPALENSKETNVSEHSVKNQEDALMDAYQNWQQGRPPALENSQESVSEHSHVPGQVIEHSVENQEDARMDQSSEKDDEEMEMDDSQSAHTLQTTQPAEKNSYNLRMTQERQQREEIAGRMSQILAYNGILNQQIIDMAKIYLKDAYTFLKNRSAPAGRGDQRLSGDLQKIWTEIQKRAKNYKKQIAR